MFNKKRKAPKGVLAISRLIALIIICTPLVGEAMRIELSLNDGWLFTKDEIKEPSVAEQAHWTPVSLPHTWNDKDVNDDIPGYYRGICWYRKLIILEPGLRNKNLYLNFKGINQVAEVYINGKKAGSHTGGYTAFSIPVKSFIRTGEKTCELLVKVNNSRNDNIPPLSGDFTFFGGIYRGVSLLATEGVHFSINDGSNGVFVTTPKVSVEKASVQLKSLIENETSQTQKIDLIAELKDQTGRLVKRKITTLSLKPGSNVVNQFIDNVEKPFLWSPEDPYLYTVYSCIKKRNSENPIDELCNPLGFRWFRFDAKSGFYLNGKQYKLIGASRHQDFKGLGNALPETMHYRDVKLLKEMGGNFLRVAHYPQDQSVLTACDRLGILTSIEIPVVNTITETEEFYQNCRNMQVEMIRQNYNHPSVILWGYMNEVMLRPKFSDNPERQKIYYQNITKLAANLDSLTRQEDPSRYTMIANHGDYNRYHLARLTEIPMLIGWNLYQGWYSGTTKGFADFMDMFHAEHPSKPVMVTEYGADADPRIHSLTPERFDKSLEYSLSFHQYYLKVIKERPFIAAAMIWNLADFNSESREETMPHINNKGLLTLDRQPKDLYSFYQANLLERPYVKISNWRNRSGLADTSGTRSTQDISVFSNASEVRLFHNGKDLGKATAVENVFTWKVSFQNGPNKLEAVINQGGTEYRDIAEVIFHVIPLDLKIQPITAPINALLGSKRIFTEELTGEQWIPAPEYKPGSWGYIGGEPFKIAGNARQGYGTDRNIRNTDNDPVYQTQQVGIQKFRFDVPDGEYELSLHFAELTTNETKEALAYNLDNKENKVAAENRVFNISVNGERIFDRFNIAERYGSLNAGREQLKLAAVNGKGIELAFEAVSGRPVLNAVQLRKLK